MATDRQKEAARRNAAKAQQAQSARAQGAARRGVEGMSTAEQNRLDDKGFAFPKERKSRSPTPGICATRPLVSIRSRT
jgi:hypothetical protein